MSSRPRHGRAVFAYKTLAYPINGVKYTDDAYIAAALNPNDIAFYWIGPKAEKSKSQVKITQYARDFKSGKSMVLAGPVIKGLPAKTPTPKELEYDISFYSAEGFSYFNGVCAYPVIVYLKDIKGNEAPPEAYDRLVFYGLDSTGAVNHEKVIGANPADNDYMAVIPAEWGGKVTTPQPRYGFKNLYPQGAAVKGRLFYMFATPTSNADRSTDVQLLDDKGEIVKSNTFKLSRMDVKVSATKPRLDEINSDMEISLELRDNAALELSDPTKGDFDFVFDKLATEGRESYYIIPLLPEGMNERHIAARFDFSTFNRGFYMRPVTAGDRVMSFNVSSNTSSLHNTCGKDIYACPFDIYGRYDRSPLFKDTAKKRVKIGKDSYISYHIVWTSEDCANVPEAFKDKFANRFMMGLLNNTPLPFVYSAYGDVTDSKNDYKARSFPRINIIVAPKKSSFFATGDDQIIYVDTEQVWQMEGRSLLVADFPRFHNRYYTKKTTGGNAGLVQIKSERLYKDKSDTSRPLGTDGIFHFFYTNADKRATNWTVRYNYWANVLEGCGYCSGKWRDLNIDGGDFTGTMHNDWFNPVDW